MLRAQKLCGERNVLWIVLLVCEVTKCCAFLLKNIQNCKGVQSLSIWRRTLAAEAAFPKYE